MMVSVSGTLSTYYPQFVDHSPKILIFIPRVVRVARTRKGIRNSSDSGLETGGWGDVGFGGEKRGAVRGNGGRKDGSLFYRCPVILGHKSYSVSRPLSRALQQEAPPRPLRFITMRFAPSFLPASRPYGGTFLPSLFTTVPTGGNCEPPKRDKFDERRSVAQIDSLAFCGNRANELIPRQ